MSSSTGWFGRIGSSIKGVLFGLVLIVGAVILLFFNEGRAVKTQKSLEQGEKELVTITAENPDATNDGKLVYFTGEATSDDKIMSDPEFGVSAEGLRLMRTTEYYQWDEDVKTETKKKLGGGEETVKTYNYKKKWTSRPIDSSRFERSAGHENPSPAVKSRTWNADPVTVGAFTLSSGLIKQIDHFSPLPVDQEAELPEQVGGKKVQVADGGFYLGETPSSPEVGDVRVKHQIAKPGMVSVVAKQQGYQLKPFVADAGGKIEMLEVGEKSSASMFEAAHQGNKVMTWILRALGFGLMFAGFGMIFKPLSVLADVVPLFGNIVGAGTGIIAFLLTIVISFVVISFAWIFYRPLIGVPLLLIAVVGAVLLVRKLLAQKQQQAEPA